MHSRATSYPMRSLNREVKSWFAGSEKWQASMKKGKPGLLYCRCGREKILANGLCGTCYTLKPIQRSLSCRCGRDQVLARGLCATCYTLCRQDARNFGGLRELVLERDGHRCRGCGRTGAGKRSLVVHHRKPGRSVLSLMLTLCPAYHARIHKTRALTAIMPPLLRMLWRERKM